MIVDDRNEDLTTDEFRFAEGVVPGTYPLVEATLRSWNNPGPDPMFFRQGHAPPAPRAGDSEDDELFLAVGRGDRDRAMPELYRRYERRVYSLGLRLLRDRGLAEELVQETFLRVWRTADRFDPARGTASAFLFAVARRMAIDLWRRPSSRPSPPQTDGIGDPDAEFDQVLLQLTVRDALDSLTDAHRQVLEMSYQSDLTQTAIAERLGISLGTVKSRTYHALRAFRRALEERGIDA